MVCHLRSCSSQTCLGLAWTADDSAQSPDRKVLGRVFPTESALKSHSHCPPPPRWTLKGWLHLLGGVEDSLVHFFCCCALSLRLVLICCCAYFCPAHLCLSCGHGLDPGISPSSDPSPLWMRRRLHAPSDPALSAYCVPKTLHSRPRGGTESLPEQIGSACLSGYFGQPAHRHPPRHPSGRPYSPPSLCRKRFWTFSCPPHHPSPLAPSVSGTPVSPVPAMKGGEQGL